MFKEFNLESRVNSELSLREHSLGRASISRHHVTQRIASRYSSKRKVNKNKDQQIKCHAPCTGFHLRSCSQQLCSSQVSREWLQISVSRQPDVSDSCSSHFGSRKARRTIETAETPESKFEPILPTTLDDLTTDQTPMDMQPRLDKHHHHHRELCDAEKSDLCLNGGTCYEIVIRKEPEPFCECATHFEGYRCQYKSLEGSYGGGIRLPRSNPRKNRRLVSRMLYLCFVLFCLACDCE